MNSEPKGKDKITALLGNPLFSDTLQLCKAQPYISAKPRNTNRGGAERGRKRNEISHVGLIIKVCSTKSRLATTKVQNKSFYKPQTSHTGYQLVISSTNITS